MDIIPINKNLIDKFLWCNLSYDSTLNKNTSDKDLGDQSSNFIIDLSTEYIPSTKA